MEKTYLLKKGNEEVVLFLAENVLKGYGLSVESGETSYSVKPIMRGSTKYGYVHCNGLILGLELDLPLEYGNKIKQELEEKLGEKKLLFSPTPLPEALPIEIYTDGKKTTTNSEKTAIEAIKSSRFPLEERMFRQGN